MTRQELLELLDEKGIRYEITEHVPVFTIEEMLEAELPHPEIIAKNLFVRDDKKRNYYLITAKEDRRMIFRILSSRELMRKIYSVRKKRSVISFLKRKIFRTR